MDISGVGMRRFVRFLSRDFCASVLLLALGINKEAKPWREPTNMRLARHSVSHVHFPSYCGLLAASEPAQGRAPGTSRTGPSLRSGLFRLLPGGYPDTHAVDATAG
jgi:hypothetical protein